MSRAVWLLYCVLTTHILHFGSPLTNGDLRLSGTDSSALSGILEVYYNGQWGTVCGGRDFPTAHFSFTEARVACRQLGLGFAVSYSSLSNWEGERLRYGVKDGPIFLNFVSCGDSNSNSTHLLECTHGQIGPVERDCPHFCCDHSMDIVLHCSNVSTPYNGELRLVPEDVSTSSPSSGILQLNVDRQWKGVCLEGVTQTTADVFCRQMGYTGHSHMSALGRTLQASEVWDLGSSPPSCRNNDTCISSCLQGRLPTAVSATSCPAILLSCEYDSTVSSSTSVGDAGRCSHETTPTPDKSLRLVAPSRHNQKRVDIFRSGEGWGSFCGREFSLQAANVVCKQVGFPAALDFSSLDDPSNGALEPLATGGVYDISCTGLETHVSECNITTSQSCTTHQHDVTVHCSPVLHPYGAVSLRGPEQNMNGGSGTLVLSFAPKFDTVCDVGFGDEEAAVACRQMGYVGGVAIPNSYFGSSSATAEMLQLLGSCSGSETSLLSCPTPPAMNYSQQERLYRFNVLNPSTEGCRPGLDEVAVQCFSSAAGVGVRLVGGADSSAGRLQVQFGGAQWGRVCAPQFGRREALVVCKSLGYQSVILAEISSRYGVSNAPFRLRNVSCWGIEQSLFHCGFESIEGGATSCSYDNMDVNIECGADPLSTDWSLRLVDGERTEYNESGRLEISLNGEWLSVCSTLMSEEAAMVACRQLGFTNVSRICRDACFGEGTDGIFFGEDHCIGAEGSLRECDVEQRRATSNFCNHTRDMGLVCAGRVGTTEVASSPVTTAATTERETDRTLFYIIGAAVGGAVLLILTVLVAICCVCCCVRKMRRKNEGTWKRSAATSSYSTRASQNGHSHSHCNGAVGDISHLSKEKGFDDPNLTLEMKTNHHTITFGNHYHSPTHDVIVHALNHSEKDASSDSYDASSSSRSSDQQQHSSHQQQQMWKNGDMHTYANGISHVRTSHLSSSSSDFPTHPPPNYDELFEVKI